jgi:Rad3-related DNA helicase
MRTPSSIGLPEKFESWRKGQDRALKDILYSSDRFDMLTTPTGSGKSATYMGLAALHDHQRVCVLTATRALQDQLLSDFRAMGLIDMRGRQNYNCEIAEVTAAEAACTAGVFCEYLKVPGCGYYDQRRRAAASRLVVTNYAYWLHDEESRGIGGFDVLVLDEAHTAPDQISDFAAVEVGEAGLRELGLPLPGQRAFRTWAPDTIERIERVLTATVGTLDMGKRKRARRLQRDLGRLCRLSEQDWVASADAKTRRWRWDLIEPGLLAEDLLFRGAKKVIFASASVRKKTLEMLGVDQHVSVHEQESSFPVRRRPVYYWPAVNVKRGMTEAQSAQWVEAIDLIIDARRDRKGIIHSVSYDRAWEILRRSRHRTSGIFIVDSRKSKTADLVAEFRASDRARVLVSPAVATGLDFPFSQCEYQIIPKVPFPDLSSPLVRARQERDKTYGAYSALQTIVQETGRGMRAEDDQCETFVTDSNLGWLMARHWNFAPRWWHAAVKSVDGRGLPPAPPPALNMDEDVDC